MMRTLEVTGQFKKDLKVARKRNLQIDKLYEVVNKLLNDEELPPKNRDHALHGDFEGTRECHIEPDWLLIYSKTEGTVQIMTLIRTGTHSDLF